MIRTFILATSVALVALPALAEQRCSQPYPPEIPTGATVTKQQILSMRDDAKAFIAASDIYQSCLLKNAYAVGHSSKNTYSLIEDNQKDKERIGAAFNAAVRTASAKPD